jgi:threonine/homoserine/homoserine lactone efflux protein
MTGYFDEFIMIGIIGLLGALSPGPAFVLISQQTLLLNRTVGFMTLFGVILATTVHITYCLYGLSFLATESTFIFQVIQYFGALYLFYLGWHALQKKKKTASPASEQHSSSTYQTAFKRGFFVNILNPENPLFFMSIFSQILDVNMPFDIKMLFACELVIISFCCLSCFIFLFSTTLCNTLASRWQLGFERCLGGILIFLGLRLITL